MKNKQKLFVLSCIFVLMVSANTLYAKTERYSFDVFLWGIKVGELVYSIKKASDEYYISGVPDSGWIHVSYKKSDNRKESLIKNKGEGYIEWR